MTVAELQKILETWPADDRVIIRRQGEYEELNVLYAEGEGSEFVIVVEHTEERKQ